MFADLDWFFRVSWTNITWNFFFRLKQSLSTWETIMRFYLPCRGRGLRWSGASRSSVIHSGFTNMFQIKTFFSKTQNLWQYAKTIFGILSPTEGAGMVLSVASRSWLVLSGFPNTYHVKIFLRNSKIRISSYISSWMFIFPTVRVGGGMMGCVSISSDSFEFFQHFAAQNFSPIRKIRKVREKP